MPGNGTELAKAYIQIIPSMEGTEGRLKQLLDEQADEAGSSAGSRLGEGIVGKITGVLAAAGVGKLIGDSFLAGADLEQSLGGVETLFKSNADDVIAYADDAFKTAGMSANAYMETATGFSASLLKSLGGDTKAAAEYTNTAITDMSDNVNKFGGDLTSLQNAYQGFSRENFTMLDNLKLGYAGNREGMQQLLSDAEKLSGVHYDISSYSDIISAVHVIQQDLGVTGTTAEEAGKTFSGSFASMKAAANNLLSDLSTGRDTKKAVDDLADSTGNFAGNVVRMSKNMISGLSQADDIIAGQLNKHLGISENAVKGAITVLEAGAAAYVAYKGSMEMSSAAQKAATAISKVTDAAKDGGSALKALNIDPFGAAVAGAALLGVAVKSAIDKATDSIDEAVSGYDSLTDAQKQFIDSTNESISKINEDMTSAFDAVDSIDGEVYAIEAMKERLYELDDAVSLTTEQKSEMNGIVEQLNGTLPELNLMLDEETGHLTNQRTEIDALIESYKSYAKAQAAQEQLVQLYKDQFEAEKTLAQAEKEREGALNTLGQLELDLLSKQKERNEFVENIGKAQEYWTNEEQARYDILTAAVGKANEAIKEQSQGMSEINTAYISAKEATRDVNSSIGKLTGTLAENNKETTAAYDAARKAAESSGEMAENYKLAGENLSEYVEKAKAALDEEYETAKATYQKQYDDLKAILNNEYQAKKTAYDEQYNSYKSALDKEEQALADANERKLNELQESQQKEIEEFQKAAEKKIEKLEASQQKEVEKLEKATEKKIALINKEYEESLKLVDKEEYDRIKAIEGQIDSINAQSEAEEEARQQAQQQQKIAQLKQKVLDAASAEDKTKAQQELNDYLSELDFKEREKRRRQQIEALNAEKEAVKAHAEDEKLLLKEEADKRTAIAEEEGSTQLGALKEKHSTILSEEKAAYNEQLNALKEAKNTELTELKAANDTQLSAVRASNSSKLEALKTAYDTELGALKKSGEDKLARLSASNDGLLKQLKEDQEEQKKSWDNTYNDISKRMDEGAADAGTQTQQLVKNIQTELNNCKPEMEKLGKEIADKINEGLRYGITDNSSVLDAVKQESGNIVNAYKSPEGLDIHSPSRRIRMEVGRMISPAIALGIEDEQQQAIRAAQRMSAAVSDSMSVDTPSLSFGIGRGVLPKSSNAAPSSAESRTTGGSTVIKFVTAGGYELAEYLLPPLNELMGSVYVAESRGRTL